MSNSDARTAREQWGSRFGFLMAMLGAMVGAGIFALLGEAAVVPPSA